MLISVGNVANSKEVEIGANGTQKYVVKEGPNKGKIL